MASENYFGNPNLKRIGVAIDYTEEQILEIKKCSEDYKYFIDNYCYIVTVDSGLQPFKLWKFQKTYLDILHNNRKIIVKFPRQTSKCLQFITLINIRNKHTGELKSVAIGEFHEMCGKEKNMS